MVLNIVLNTSILISCDKRKPEDERPYLIKVRKFLMDTDEETLWFVFTDIINEYKKVPNEIERCGCSLDSFGHAFLLVLRKLPYIRPGRKLPLSKNTSLVRTPAGSSERLRACVSKIFDELKLEKNDKKFGEIAAAIAKKGEDVWIISLDKKIYESGAEISRRIKSECHIKGRLYVTKPSEFIPRMTVSCL